MKFFISFCLIVLDCVHLQAQNLVADMIFDRISHQCLICPTEKVYLHTDRSTYVAGETIWMRAYVVDGIVHRITKESKYVYVVLQNPLMGTVAKVRMRADKDGFIYGNIPLPDDLPKGEYSLCAYTQHMRNFDSEYFFKKQIIINNILNNDIQIEAFQNDKSVDLRFFNPVTRQCKDVRNVSVHSSSGEINIYSQDSIHSIKLRDVVSGKILVKAGNYKEFIHIDLNSDYDVAFLPEGGNLVADNYNRVAFKSINKNGLGENIIGTVYDENDSIITTFKTLNRGMGVLAFIPQNGKKYKAVCENEKGKQKTFRLPDATAKYSIQVNQFRDKVYVKVLSAVPYTESLLVFAHQRGWPVKIGEWSSKTPGLICNKNDFIEGVASLLLVNEAGSIVSERMIFIQNSKPLKGILKTDQQEYRSREKMTIQLQVSDKWWNGDCSVSVTDNNDVQQDSCIHILSSLLLSSDLRGHIEAPAWYFQEESDSSNLRVQALDALMMTQGWKKYDMEDVWARRFRNSQYPFEKSLRITGRVTSKTARKAVNRARIEMMVPTLGVKEETKSKGDGTFLLEGFDAPEGTVYWIGAYSDKGKDNVVLEIDSIIHPVLEKSLPPLSISQTLTKRHSYLSGHLAKNNLRFINETGIKHLFLDEVVVTAPKLEFRTEAENNIANKAIKESEIEESGVADLPTLLYQKIPSLQMGYKKDERSNEPIPIISMRGDGSPVAVILDGVMLNPLLELDNLQALQTINSLSKDDVMQVDVIKGAQAVAYHSKAEGGVIIITTKQGDKKYNAKWHPTNLKIIMPLGFQQPVEFYTPKYELHIDKGKKEPDLRTTIHWQPRLEVKNGKARIEFYTADGIVDYTVVIEGVGEDGSLLRVEERIK